jgi:hypothetical protein
MEARELADLSISIKRERERPLLIFDSQNIEGRANA